jgi:hypothetical protein
MARRRALVAVGLALALVATAGGGGAVSAATVERSVTVAVVDDDRAYLGVEREPVENGTWNLTLTNRLWTTLEVTVAVDGDRVVREFAPRARHTLVLTVAACGGRARLVATAEDVRISLVRIAGC